MTPAIKNILIQAAKNATNAALVTIAPMLSAPDRYNWHTLKGLEHMGAVVLGAILAREALVWGPKILAWSQTGETPQPAAASKAAGG